MSRFKMKRGQESKVNSLAKEDGSLIFSLNGANNSTVRLDQTVNGTVQRLGIAVDKAKSADSSSVASTANVAKLISPFENATANASRNVWFSDSEVRNKPVYNDNFKYNPITQILTTNISGSAEFANLIKYYQSDSQFYASGDTHIMELGYLKCDGSYQNLTLYITSAFWGNQHGSADFINIQQDTNTNSSATVQSYVHALRVGGNYDRTFYAYKDQANKRLYLYVQVIGGNSYGKWNVSVIQCSSGYNAWVSEFGFNKVLPTGYEIISKIFLGTANNSNALGGSSLSQILASAGGGNAFTGLETTTNNKIKLTRANGKTVEKTINNVSNASSASFASTATLTAYPQGFDSRTTSATWGNTTGAFLTGWHTSSGGDVAFMNDNPSSGKVSMKLDGYFYQNEGANRVLDTSDAANYVKKSGDTMTGALNFANNTWNKVGDDVKIGDHNIAGSLGVIGANGQTRIDWCQYDNASKYQGIVYDGTKLATSGTFKADYFEGTIANATSAENASHLGGKPSSDYALKADLPGDINALSAKRLQSYQSASVANSFFYRYGTAGNTSDGGAWTGFPSATLYSEASTANGFGSALFRKKVGVLHLASGSSAHDLVFQAGGTNGGIAYVATGRNPAYILDTLNYKDKAYTFNKLTASSTFTATSGVVIDGGSY